jgi:hypothetical protein
MIRTFECLFAGIPISVLAVLKAYNVPPNILIYNLSEMTEEDRDKTKQTVSLHVGFLEKHKPCALSYKINYREQKSVDFED